MEIEIDLLGVGVVNPLLKANIAINLIFSQCE